MFRACAIMITSNTLVITYNIRLVKGFEEDPRNR